MHVPSNDYYAHGDSKNVPEMYPRGPATWPQKG